MQIAIVCLFFLSTCAAFEALATFREEQARRRKRILRRLYA